MRIVEGNHKVLTYEKRNFAVIAAMLAVTQTAVKAVKAVSYKHCVISIIACHIYACMLHFLLDEVNNGSVG